MIGLVNFDAAFVRLSACANARDSYLRQTFGGPRRCQLVGTSQRSAHASADVNFMIDLTLAQ